MLRRKLAGSSVLSTDLKLALSPTSTYRALVDERTKATWWQMTLRPAFSLTLFGSLLTITATGHVTIPLLFHVGLSWIILLVWQAVAAAVVILTAPRRKVSRARAFELFFVGHAPWSLFILAMTALGTTIPPNSVSPLIVTSAGLVPVAWTSMTVSSFCQTVLGLGRAEARRRTAFHQLVVWGGALAFLWYAVGGWTPILQQVGL
jgi:hypothetical protein